MIIKTTRAQNIENRTAVYFMTAFALAIYLLIFPDKTYAQIGIACPDDTTYIAIFDLCMNFGTTISYLINWSLILGTLIALVKFSIGAVQMIMSTGQPTKLENARMTVTDAALGFVLIATAWVLLAYLQDALPQEWGVSFLTLFPVSP